MLTDIAEKELNHCGTAAHGYGVCVERVRERVNLTVVMCVYLCY